MFNFHHWCQTKNNGLISTSFGKYLTILKFALNCSSTYFKLLVEYVPK